MATETEQATPQEELQEELEEGVILLTEEGGKQVPAKAILTFELRDRQYMALQPIEKGEEVNIGIYELIEEELGQRLVPIQRDARGLAVWNKFRRLLEESKEREEKPTE